MGDNRCSLCIFLLNYIPSFSDCYLCFRNIIRRSSCSAIVFVDRNLCNEFRAVSAADKRCSTAAFYTGKVKNTLENYKHKKKRYKQSVEVWKGRGFCVCNTRGWIVFPINLLMGQPLLFLYLQCSINSIENIVNSWNQSLKRRERMLFLQGE